MILGQNIIGLHKNHKKTSKNSKRQPFMTAFIFAKLSGRTSFWKVSPQIAFPLVRRSTESWKAAFFAEIAFIIFYRNSFYYIIKISKQKNHLLSEDKKNQATHHPR